MHLFYFASGLYHLTPQTITDATQCEARLSIAALDLDLIVLGRQVPDRVGRAMGRPDVVLEQHHQHSVVGQGGEVFLVIHLQDNGISPGLDWY